MNTGSADERKYLHDVGRIAAALERIAQVVEDLQDEDEDGDRAEVFALRAEVVDLRQRLGIAHPPQQQARR